MGFKCGIVGLPNVGKSTLFNALTRASISASNFPFCTIEPNSGVVMISDVRLQALSQIVNPERVLPTSIEFVDIAGLVKGASTGEGLGNRFLANIRETDAIAHVVRCFNDENIIHVANEINPKSDIEIINMELILADLDSCEKQHQRISRVAKGGDKIANIQKILLEKLIPHLEEGNPIRSFSMNEEEKHIANMFHLLTSKPTMYIANVDENGLENNSYLDTVKEIAKEEGAIVIAICSKLESEISELDKGEVQEFLDALGWEESGLNRVVRAGYQLLDLQTYFTAGPKEVRAWTYPKGMKAPQAAGVIHTDFERGFIRAEVIGFEDFIRCKGEQKAKEEGRLRSEGKDYIVQDGDVVHFRFNV